MDFRLDFRAVRRSFIALTFIEAVLVTVAVAAEVIFFSVIKKFIGIECKYQFEKVDYRKSNAEKGRGMPDVLWQDVSFITVPFNLDRNRKRCCTFCVRKFNAMVNNKNFHAEN